MAAFNRWSSNYNGLVKRRKINPSNFRLMQMSKHVCIVNCLKKPAVEIE